MIAELYLSIGAKLGMQEQILEQDFYIKSSQGQMPVFAAISSSVKAEVGSKPSEEPSINTAKTIIIIHEIFGLNEHIKDIARRFAAEGFSVFAPDLFFKAKEQNLDCNDLATMRLFWQALADDELMASLSSVYQLAYSFKLASSGRGPGKIGVLGFCIGGAIASMFAGYDEETAFLVDFYGRIKYPELSSIKPKHPIDYARNIQCPVLGIFSNQDELISQNDVDLFKKNLETKNIPVQIKMYDAPHAFFNDTRENYRQEAAQDAWKTTIEFLKSV